MPKVPKTIALESEAYLDGLFQDFTQQMSRYKDLVAHSMGLEARLELAEKTLCLTRDHLKMALGSTEGGESRIREWMKQAAAVRFVGVRLIDACVTVLKEHPKITPQKLFDAVNEGNFRFRTNAPLREIHAAVLRHPNVKRDGLYYIWTAPKEKQMTMRVKGKQTPTLVAEAAIEDGGEAKPN
jgi:hypothetical protein